MGCRCGHHPNGTLAGYSNACGATAAYCIAAVGSNVTVAVGTNVFASGYGVGSGTSFAAPAVAGAIALLMSAAPNITAQQALQILFETANKTGIYAQTAIYGQGVLDLNQAMQPVGQVTVSANGVTAAPASMTTIALGSAFGAQPMQALAATPMVVQDSFKRDFEVTLSSRVVEGAPPLEAGYRLALFGRPALTVYSDGQDRLDLIQDPNPWRTAPDNAPVHFIAHRSIGLDTTFSFGVGVDPIRVLATDDREPTAAFSYGMLAPGSISNPYLSLIDNALVASLDFLTLGNRITVVAAFGQPFVPEGVIADPDVNVPHIFGGEVQMSFPIKTSSVVRFDMGTLIENNSLLGSVGGGAGRIGHSTSWTAGLSTEIALARDTSLVAGIHTAISAESAVSGSLVQDATDVVSFSGGLGLVQHNVMTPGDELTFGAGLPLRAVSGIAHLLVPDDVSSLGSVSAQPLAIGLRADGREEDFSSH